MTPHLNRLDETVQMRGHNIWFRREIKKNYHPITPSYLESELSLQDSSETVQEPNRAKLGGTSGGVVVSGEASESDEEEVNTDEIHQLPPLKGTVKPAYRIYLAIRRGFHLSRMTTNILISSM